MPVGLVVRKNQYYDSVFLMGVNKRLSEQPGVQQTAVLMASEANKGLLAEIGVRDGRIDAAQPNDLVIAVVADSQEIADSLLAQIDRFFESSHPVKAKMDVRTLQDGLGMKPQANLAVISVPGEYAAREARLAVEKGLNVFLFSNHVTLEDEIALKKLAQERGVLVMGPDCGTSLLGGVGIGFANRVRRGSVGAIGPSGTGMQEFTCLVHHLGMGISHAIGTGSRDLSDAVGGVTTLAALEALENNPETELIALISKPPGRKVVAALTGAFRRCRKPVIACFLGIDDPLDGEGRWFHRVKTIDEAAQISARLVDAGSKNLSLPQNPEQRLREEAARLLPQQKFVRGLFAGGTFCYQSQQIFRAHGIPVYSNAPLDKKYALLHPNASQEHSLVDMGDEEFTRGKPHPMIDGTERNRRILVEGRDPAVAALLLDFILGYNSSKDPAGELAEAIQEVRREAAERGGYLSVVASITGTELDPQDLGSQQKILEDCGAVVFPTNATATDFCVRLLRR